MSQPPSGYRPIVIIGAGRSGTKILRDSLCRLPGAGTWPCDEINYIWRHGNAAAPDDEFGPERARPGVRRYIRRRFDRLARRRALTHVVEKTCANSLRVAFVDRVVPDALFVVLVRDGRDVVASARKRWTASLDLPYLAAKARFVPLTDVPYYGLRYLKNRLYRRFVATDERLASWGPRFDGMAAMVRSEDLAIVCAHQWRRCVERADAALAAIDPARVVRLRYEDFAARPAPALAELARAAGIAATQAQVAAAAGGVTAGRIGAWRDDFQTGELDRILPVLSPVLARHGYETGPS
jgi:hypothetical protein